MFLITFLIVFLIDRFSVVDRSRQVVLYLHALTKKYLFRAEPFLAKMTDSSLRWIAFCSGVVPLFFFALIFWWAYSWPWWLNLVFNIISLHLFWGCTHFFSSLSRIEQACLAGDGSKLEKLVEDWSDRCFEPSSSDNFIGIAVVRAYYYVFSPLICYALIGSLGAVLLPVLRINIAVWSSYGRGSLDSAIFLRRLVFFIDCVLVRITVFLLSLVGDFLGAFRGAYFFDIKKDPIDVLKRATYGVMNLPVVPLLSSDSVNQVGAPTINLFANLLVRALLCLVIMGVLLPY